MQCSTITKINAHAHLDTLQRDTARLCTTQLYGAHLHNRNNINFKHVRKLRYFFEELRKFQKMFGKYSKNEPEAKS